MTVYDVIVDALGSVLGYDPYEVRVDVLGYGRHEVAEALWGEEADPETQYWDRGLAPAPTRTLPHTPEREAIYRSRLRMGYQLKHPRDAVRPGD